LSDADLLARMMLSEESYKILDPVKYEDAVGAAWTAINRTKFGSGYSYAEDNLYKALVAESQYDGMISSGNAAWAADPENPIYQGKFAVGNPNAGREAYWRAFELAQGMLNGEIADPTDGRRVYADELIDGTKRERTAFWYFQGTTINDPSDPHLSIPQIRARQFFEIRNWPLKRH
jgi:hypothetical protein